MRRGRGLARWGNFAAGASLLLAFAVAGCEGTGSNGLVLDPAHREAAPRGYIAFCTREPKWCDGHGVRTVALNAKRWSQLLSANDSVNSGYRPAMDRPAVGTADDWEIPTGAAGTTADCEDYVLAKKAKLIALGWPKTALRIALVDVPHAPRDARRHAILLADTSEGIFVLDNLERKVLRWTDVDYEWVSVQASTDPDLWEGVKRTASSR